MSEGCKSCPFREGSDTFRHRDDWLKQLELHREKHQIEPSMPQGCHMLENGQKGKDSPFQEDTNLQCKGHLLYMKQIQ
jgi:hypothetical protein